MNWKKFTFEFLSIFIAVLAAFALNNWNENRRDRLSENKILSEINNGLTLDLNDIKGNKFGHELGLRSCQYFREYMDGVPVNLDSLPLLFIILTRDFTSIMNKSGYESLKSKGLEVVQNDSIRYSIIALYDYYYQLISKLEEQATEMQSFENYFAPINALLLKFLIFDEKGNLVGLKDNPYFTEDQRTELLSYLWRIQNNRRFKLNRYGLIEERIKALQEMIKEELPMMSKDSG